MGDCSRGSTKILPSKVFDNLTPSWKILNVGSIRSIGDITSYQGLV